MNKTVKYTLDSSSFPPDEWSGIFLISFSLCIKTIYVYARDCADKVQHWISTQKRDRFCFLFRALNGIRKWWWNNDDVLVLILSKIIKYNNDPSSKLGCIIGATRAIWTILLSLRSSHTHTHISTIIQASHLRRFTIRGQMKIVKQTEQSAHGMRSASSLWKTDGKNKAKSGISSSKMVPPVFRAFICHGKKPNVASIHQVRKQ